MNVNSRNTQLPFYTAATSPNVVCKASILTSKAYPHSFSLHLFNVLDSTVTLLGR